MDNKTLTDILSKRLDVSLDTVNSMMEGLTKIVGDSCAELDSVALPAFGTFEPRKRLEGWRCTLHPGNACSFLQRLWSHSNRRQY